MGRSSREVGTELWRELIERLDEGVLIFSDRGIVIYANDSAARLLGYTPRDVLELDRDDLISLCQHDRLDEASFARALLTDSLPNTPGQRYEIATANNRLLVTPFRLEMEHGSVTVLLLREQQSWRAELINQTLVSSDMQGPLLFADTYCQMLLSRLESGKAYPFELLDLARIASESVERALALWETLAHLNSTDPAQEPDWVLGPASLAEVVDTALRAALQRHQHSFPVVDVKIPEDLPCIAASEQHLPHALSALLEGVAQRLTHHDHIRLVAHHQRRYVQIDLMVDKAGLIHGYQLDTLPLAVAEQIILRHSGRIWIEAPDQSGALSVSLPVWVEADACAPEGQPSMAGDSSNLP